MKNKIIHILSILFLCAVAAGTAVAQDNIEDTRVTIEVKDVTMSEFLNKLREVTQLSISYSGSTTDKYRITLSVKDQTLKEILSLAFKNKPLQYKVMTRGIIVFEKKNINEADIPASAGMSVTGTVTDKSGSPLPGVSIFIKGTSTGTTSDANGKYSIEFSPAGGDQEGVSVVIVFSFIGLKTNEVIINGRSTIDVVMEDDAKVLQEVQINAGYYSVTDEERTGSIARVTAKDIEKQPVSNVLQALQGRMPGVSIDQGSGVPGGNFRVRIRGTNSLSSGNDPLYIIDGIPFVSQSLSGSGAILIYLANGDFKGASPMNSINPNDIESIEVLKDADATAIYGSRASNGVVLITTKKGKSGGTKLNIDFKSGVSKVTRFMDLLNTKQYIKMRWQAVENDARYNQMDTIPKPDEYDINGTWSQKRYTNWQKVLIGGTARMNDLNASLSGGNDNTRFLFSTGYNDQNTVFPGETKFTRFSIHFSVTHLSKDQKLDIKLSTNYSINKSNLLAADLTATALRLAPNAPRLYEADGKLNWENGTWGNPLSYLKNRFLARTYNLLTGVELGYAILPNLRIKTNVGLNDIRNEEKSTNSSDSYSPFYNPTPALSSLFMSSATNQSLIIEPQASWQTRIGNGKLDALLGGTYQTRINEGSSESFTGFASNALIENPNAAASVDFGTYGYSHYKYTALFGRINYNWDGKYILNLTGRRDGSSRFGPNRKFANMGAVGVAWVFTNEKFFTNSESTQVISFGKLRASYGTTGNDQIGDYQYLDSYGAGAQYGKNSTLGTSRLFNPDYSWEVNKKFEAAIETGFLNDRVLWTTAFYLNRSSNQLINYLLAGTTGYQTILLNFPATIQNKGVELELTTLNIKTEKFTWTTNWNITFPKNELVRFPGLESSSYANIFVVGKPLSITKAYHFLGVNPETGMNEVEDMNNDGQITPDDKQAWVIRGQQKYFGGLNNSISFEGFQIDIFVQFASQYGNTVSPQGQLGYFNSTGYTTGNQLREMVNNSWSKPGDQAEFQYLSRSSKLVASQTLYEESDATSMIINFMRLKNVSISYELPGKWIKGAKAKIYLQSQNIFTITNYKGQDPETGSGSLPPLTTIVAGVQLNL